LRRAAAHQFGLGLAGRRVGGASGFAADSFFFNRFGLFFGVALRLLRFVWVPGIGDTPLRRANLSAIQALRGDPLSTRRTLARSCGRHRRLHPLLFLKTI
jgi:hypothetical protein